MAGEISTTEQIVEITTTENAVAVTVTDSTVAVTASDIGLQGPTGATGVVTATSPITYNSGTQTVAFDNTGFVRTTIANTFTTGAQLIKTGADAIKGLILQRNSASQTANILSVVQSDGTTELARVRPIGQIGIGTLITNTALGINTDLVGDNRAIVIKAGLTAPTNNAIELLPLANNTPVMKVDFAGNITAPTFVGNVTGNVSGNAGTVTNGVYTTDKGAANGVATLDGSGLIPTTQLPPLAISDTFVVASQAEMLALTAQVGDVAVRTDVNKTFILQSSPASTLANWIQILTPPAVTSISTSSPITGGTITTTGTIGINDGTTTQKGAVQLEDSVSSTSTTTAATPNSVKTVADSDALKAPLASPALTGTPTTTTATVDTNTTQIASTAFVLGQANTATTPIVDGTATIGTSTRYARADHIHPTDTSRASAPLYYAPATFITTENRATTDFSPLSSTATFGVSLAASTAYEINIELIFDYSDIAVNSRTLSFGFRLGSGTLTSIGYDVTHNRKSTTLTDTVYHQSINAIGISPIELSRSSNVGYESVIRAKGIVTVNTASKLIPTFQWNALGDTFNVRRGSYVQFTPLPNTTSNGTWA